MYQAEIPIKAIEVKDRFRQDFGNLEELKLSIKEHGLICPIAIQNKGKGHFRLLAGERRLRACTDLGWEKIDAKVWNDTDILTDLDIYCIELAENLYRKDMTWQEKVRLEARIHEMQVGEKGEKVSRHSTGHSQADTAKFLGVKQSEVSVNLKLAKAFEVVPELAESATREEALKKLRLLQETAIHEELLKRSQAQATCENAVPEETRRMAMCEAYVVGDACEHLKAEDAEAMDFIEIDPPYAIDLDKLKQGEAKDKEEYKEVQKEAYYQFMGVILDEATRILKPGRWLVLWHAEEHEYTLRNMLTKRGFTVCNTAAIWVKPSGQTNHPEYEMASCYERFFYASKGSAILLNQGRGNVFHVSPVPPTRKIHPTEKPIELLEAIFKTFALKGQKMLVPFLGSGASIMAAANLGIEAYGFDLSPMFKKSYEVRILTQAYGKYFNTTQEATK